MASLADALGIRLDDDGDSWRDHAACADGSALESFFVEASSKVRAKEPGQTASDARALRVCTRCPEWVRRECLSEQVQWETSTRRRMFGIYGGTTPAMRNDPRVRKLNVRDKTEALLAWSKVKVLPTLLAPGETLAE